MIKFLSLLICFICILTLVSCVLPEGGQTDGELDYDCLLLGHQWDAGHITKQASLS